MSRLALAGALLVAGLFVAAAVVRWPAATPYGSDHDEYRIVAGQLADGRAPLVAGVEATKYPLGYPALLAAGRWLGVSAVTTAFALNIAAVAGVTGLAALATRRLGGLAQLAAAGAVAVSPGLWDSVYSVMPDTLFALAAAGIVAWVTRRSWLGAATEERILSGRSFAPAPASRTTPSRQGPRESHDQHAPDPAGTPPPTPSPVVERLAGTPVRDVVVITLLCAVATAVKSAGVLLALGVSLGLIAGRDRIQRAFWVPGAAGAAVTGLMALTVAGLPVHTTGYTQTFWLADPFDASAGRAGVGDVAARVVERAGIYVSDVGHALLGTNAPRWVAIAGALVLVAAGLAGWRRAAANRRVALAVGVGFVGVYSLGLVVWPFSSQRFGLPLVPIAAVGFGWGVAHAAGELAGRPRDRLAPPPAPSAWRWWGLAVATVVALGAFATWSLPYLSRQADAEQTKWTALHTDTADAADWLRDNVAAGERIASFDYREFARRLDRPVLPLGYTSDTDALLAASAGCGADYLAVVQGLYAQRDALADRLVGAFPDRFRRAYTNERVTIYALDAPEVTRGATPDCPGQDPAGEA